MIAADVYRGLAQHVTDRFELYDQFVSDMVFYVAMGNEPIMCRVIDKNIDPGYDGEYSPIYLVLKVAGSYYKIEGYKGSYGGVEWDPYVTEVQRKEKVVYLYE